MPRRKNWPLCLCIIQITASLFVLAANTAQADAFRDSAAIYGHVWRDEDQDGLKGEGETPLGNALIVLADSRGKVLDHTYTDDAGEYLFEGLPGGSYILSETDPEGFTSTTPNLILLDLGDQERLYRGFGDVLVLPGCFRMVSGFIWHDDDADDERDEGEQRFSGIPVRILDLDHNPVAITVSGEYGAYAARSLDPGQYHVIIDTPSAAPYSRNPLYWGIDLRGCYPVVIDFGLQESWESTWGCDYSKRTAGTRSEEDNSSVSGNVWCLEPGSQSSHSGPRAVPGVKLTLTDASGEIVAEQYSDSSGSYRFEGLRWQHYYITQAPIAGYEPALSCFWGIAATDACDIRIDFENRLSPGQSWPQLYIPFIALTRQSTA